MPRGDGDRSVSDQLPTGGGIVRDLCLERVQCRVVHEVGASAQETPAKAWIEDRLERRDRRVLARHERNEAIVRLSLRRRH